MVNVSEGCRTGTLADLAAVSAPVLLDLHSDCDHHRSVFTLAGPDELVTGAARALARQVVERVDLRGHLGVHPRLGSLDVVPFVEVVGWPLADVPTDAPGLGARQARDEFGRWAAAELGLPVFLYGPERSLPQVRREAFTRLAPDVGPSSPHRTAGAVAVGCRRLMVAYNLWLAAPDLAQARSLAASLRSPAVRALAFRVGTDVQLSFNLLAPLEVGPSDVMDKVKDRMAVARAEVVGLVPRLVLEAAPSDRWAELGLSEDVTIEQRLVSAGLGP